jgi:hypothetical protein
MTPGSQEATTNNDAAEAIAMEDLLPILRCIFAFELEPGVSLGESPKSRPAAASTRQVPTNGQRLKSPSAPRSSETPVRAERTMTISANSAGAPDQLGMIRRLMKRADNASGRMTRTRTATPVKYASRVKARSAFACLLG